MSMETDAIAGMAMAYKTVQLQQSVGMSVMKMSMDNTRDTGQALINMVNAGTQAIEKSVTPHLGVNIDILV
jgi:hypothetical protein